MFRFIVLCILLSGCAALKPKLDLRNEAAISAQIQVEYDQYQKMTRYIGPSGNVFPGATYANNSFLRATKKGSEIISVQVYIVDQYLNGWRFYDRAFSISGKRFAVTRIDRDVTCGGIGGCSYEEHLGVSIEVTDLEAALDEGLRFKIVGKGGEQEYQLTPEYVRAFYLKLTQG